MSEQPQEERKNEGQVKEEPELGGAKSDIAATNPRQKRRPPTRAYLSYLSVVQATLGLLARWFMAAPNR